MSTLTTNYGFRKDDGTEQYDVTVVNANLDLLDTTIKTVDDEVGVTQPTVAGSTYLFTAGLTPNIPHGLGRIPKHITVTQVASSGSSPVFLAVDDGTVDVTNFKIRGYTAAGAALAGNAKVMWRCS